MIQLDYQQLAIQLIKVSVRSRFPFRNHFIIFSCKICLTTVIIFNIKKDEFLFKNAIKPSKINHLTSYFTTCLLNSIYSDWKQEGTRFCRYIKKLYFDLYTSLINHIQNVRFSSSYCLLNFSEQVVIIIITTKKGIYYPPN